MTAPSWWSAAHCRGLDVDTFFPLPNDQATTQRALSICGLCPVQIPCRRYALSHGEQYGIWGGLTEATRQAIMRGAPTRVATGARR
jgi:WhiB family redox-sensing transcriptional regulator